MKCQNLYSGKNRKNIFILSVEFAQRVVKVKFSPSLKNLKNILECGLLLL